MGLTGPSDRFVARLVRQLAQPHRERVFVTDLADVMPEAAVIDDLAAGVLAVDISRDLGEYVLWYRPRLRTHG